MRTRNHMIAYLPNDYGGRLKYFDEASKSRFIPHVIEPSMGVDRIMLAVLSEFDHAENVSRSMNVLSGQLKAALSGSWIGMAPYGFRVEGTKHNKRLVHADDVGDIAAERRDRGERRSAGPDE